MGCIDYLLTTGLTGLINIGLPSYTVEDLVGFDGPWLTDSPYGPRPWEPYS